MDGRAWVTLWAEREASVQILRQNEKLLSEALEAYTHIGMPRHIEMAGAPQLSG